MRKKAAKNDFAFFTSWYVSHCAASHVAEADTCSSWFPDADWDQLLTAGLFSFWLFHCDDAMDDQDGSVSRDYAVSCRYRQQVLNYTRWSLGLSPPRPRASFIKRLLSWFQPAPKWYPPSPNLPNTVFKEFGRRTQKSTNKGKWRWNPLLVGNTR